jgi:hypothetical protein
VKIKEKTTTEKMIDQLNAAEEVMAALDQAAGNSNAIQQACRTAYERVEHARNCEARDWNDMLEGDEQRIFRCSEASNHYHTDADGPCDVWSTDQVCSLHIQRAEDQMAAREAL